MLRRFSAAVLLILLSSLLVLACTQPPSRPMASVAPVPGATQVIPPVLAVLKSSPSLPPAVAEFYQINGNRALWQRAAARASLIQSLQDLDQDGLEPEYYGLSLLLKDHRHYASLPPAQKARLDVLATFAYLHSLSHLRRGALEPNTLQARRGFTLQELGEVTSQASQALKAGKPDQAYALARPHHALYRELRQALAVLRGMPTSAYWGTVDAGPLLKPGMEDQRVPALRRRLYQAGVYKGALDAGRRYEGALVTAVTDFQREHQENADGILGGATLAALNVSVPERIQQVRADLERARWVLVDLPETYLMINIPSFAITLYQGPIPQWQSRVIVGRPVRNTPVFRSVINRVTFNPSWTVPPTILREDVLPKVRADVAYLDKNHMRVFDQSGTELSPNAVDWSQPGPITLRQDPGPENSLGQVVLRFPNAHSIYLHDTPHRELFRKENRAFSSGCIRVENVLVLVQRLLDDPEVFDADAIADIVQQGETRSIKLRTPMPILLTYLTTTLSQDGRVLFKPDVYGQNPALVRALGAWQGKAPTGKKS